MNINSEERLQPMKALAEVSYLYKRPHQDSGAFYPCPSGPVMTAAFSIWLLLPVCLLSVLQCLVYAVFSLAPATKEIFKTWPVSIKI